MFQASVIIPAYNKRELLKNCLASLKYQTVAPQSYEVIIVDDGSNDGTAAMVSEFARSSPFHVTLLYKHREGCYRVSRTRNLGILAARGQRVIMIDADMVVPPNFVEQHLKAKSSDIVIGNIYGFGTEGGPILPNDFDALSTVEMEQCLCMVRDDQANRDLRESEFTRVNYDLTRLPAPWVFFWTGNVSVPRATLLDVGLFDEEFAGWGDEDTELGYRLWKQGNTFVTRPMAWAVHQWHPRSRDTERQSHTANRYRFFLKHHDLYGELRLVASSMTYNRKLTEILHRVGLTLQPDYSLPPFSSEIAASKSEIAGQVLVIGCGRGEILSEFGDVACDIDTKNIMQLRIRYPQRKFFHLLGLQTPFPVAYFDTVVITDFWRAWDLSFLRLLFREAQRVGKKVRILCSPDFVPDLPPGIPWHDVDTARFLAKECYAISNSILIL